MNETVSERAQQTTSGLYEGYQQDRPSLLSTREEQYELRSRAFSEGGGRNLEVGNIGTNSGLVGERLGEGGNVEGIGNAGTPANSGLVGGRSGEGANDVSYPDLSTLQTPELGTGLPQGGNEGAFIQQFLQAQMTLMAHQDALRRAEETRRWEREDELRRADERRRERWESAQEGSAARSREEEWLHRQNMSMLSTLPCLSPTDDLEAYLDKLENHLKQCKVDEGRWPFYLSAKLTGRYLEMVQSLNVDEDTTYQGLKAKLLEAAGLTKHSAGVQLHNLTIRDFQGKTALEVFQTYLRLHKRLFKDALSGDDYILASMIPLLRKVLPEGGRAFWIIVKLTVLMSSWIACRGGGVYQGA